MNDAFNYVFSTISSFVSWLNAWSFLGVSFLYWIIGVSIMGILLQRIFR